ncbi:DedA family protein [Caulobacter sp. RL271]|jgi:membrane protein DedA with SNARE-associated domain|uniref:DedA family protein n=1 Tax=Caulobacter segnis TaxID=88688 RepID=A0ABY4ZUV1_9CAUL|nr:DedA family protein [Caulobacter segnis]USQ96356.1 DedA family protein [Caulobacter segnis]
MDSLLSPVSAFVSQHQAWAGPILGALTLLESMFLIGAFVPATALMLLAGGLIASGALDPVEVFFWCVAGAVLGDAISFQIGRQLGARALRHPALRSRRRAVARTRLYASRYGVVSVFVGRFFGPLRAFVPVMVGMLQMRAWVFQVANVVSAMLWVGVLLAPGYLAARGLALLELEGWALWPLLGGGAAIVLGGSALINALRRSAQRRRAALPATL